jgi:NAD(P)-dependent dehydrogenase (short-subunit alcohol dehydrogenase family)
MDLELAGKVVVVTGGSRGIGLACARAFAQEGARVALMARSPEGLAAAARELAGGGFAAHTECVDMTDASAVVAAIERIEAAVGPVDVLVNSAGAAKHHPVDSTDSGRWAEGMRDKYLPTVTALDAVIPRMARRGRGAIVNIVGVGGKLPNPLHIAGGAANAALLLVNATTAKAWGPHGIRINAINPGPIETERAQAALRVKSETSGRPEDELRAEVAARLPLGRYGQPHEVAAVAVFLASSQASYITGATLSVDGGATCLP